MKGPSLSPVYLPQLPSYTRPGPGDMQLDIHNQNRAGYGNKGQFIGIHIFGQIGSSNIYCHNFRLQQRPCFNRELDFGFEQQFLLPKDFLQTQKITPSGICPAPCTFQQCASPLCFLGCPHCRLPSKIVFHQRVSSIKGRLPLKVVFLQRSSSIKGRLPSRVVLH